MYEQFAVGKKKWIKFRPVGRLFYQEAHRLHRSLRPQRQVSSKSCYSVLLDILQDYDYNENITPLFVKRPCLYSLLIWIEYSNKGGVEKEEFRPLNLERLKCLKINPSEHGMLILLFWFMIFYVWCRFLWVQASVKRAVIIKESMPILDTRADFLQKDTIMATQLSRKKRRRRVIENWIGFS